MLDFVLQPENIPFSVALAIMLGIAVLEGVLTVLGAGLSHFLDQIIPDSFGDIDADADIDVDVLQADGVHIDAGHTELGSASAMSKMLGWLCVGKVPVLVLLVLFLTSFGLSGLAIQGVLNTVFGTLFPALLTSIGAVIAGAMLTRWSGLAIARLIPKDETDAVSRESFVGRVATITLGEARQGTPAQAKLRDRFGLVHYVMVEPDDTEEIFSRGDEILIIDRNGSHFIAVRNTNAALVD